MLYPNLLAYVGPGPGLTMFWSFVALLGTIALAVLSLLMWPIRLLIRRMRGVPPQDSTQETSQSTAPGADSAAPPR